MGLMFPIVSNDILITLCKTGWIGGITGRKHLSHHKKIRISACESFCNVRVMGFMFSFYVNPRKGALEVKMGSFSYWVLRVKICPMEVTDFVRTNILPEMLGEVGWIEYQPPSPFFTGVGMAILSQWNRALAEPSTGSKETQKWMHIDPCIL